MNLWRLIGSALLNLRTHKLRVFLTMIGIIIGISSVVTILSIGEGLQESVKQSASTADVNTITVSYESKLDFQAQVLEKPFEAQDLQSLTSVDGVDKVARSGGMLGSAFSLMGEAEYFDKKSTLFFEVYKNQKLNLVAGRSITEEDNDLKNYVVVLTEDQAKELFGDNVEEAIGKGIKIKDQYFQVIGVTKSSALSIFSLTGNSNYIPEFAQKTFSDDTQISSIDIKVKPGYDLSSVFKDVKEELQRLHPDLKGEYKQQDPNAITKAFQKIIGGITDFIAVVSGISLFVGGVGVMNIMYVSVTERKREIGIRRAIGAKPRTILFQFLIEAIFITVLGGIIGLLLGWCIASIAGVFMPFKPVLTLGILITSSVTSIIIGIVFGIIPAFKAAKLDPIKAIYH